IGDYLLPDSFDRARLRAFGQKHVESLLAILRLRKHIAKRDVRQQITVVVDVEPVNGVGMERVSIWICVEYDHGSRRVGGRLARVEIAWGSRERAPRGDVRVAEVLCPRSQFS